MDWNKNVEAEDIMDPKKVYWKKNKVIRKYLFGN